MCATSILPQLVGASTTKLIDIGHVQKTKNLTMDFYLCVHMPGTPSFDLPTPNSAVGSNLQYVPGSGLRMQSLRAPGFQDCNALSLRSGVVDQNYLPRVFSGHFTEPNSITAPAGNRFGSVKRPKYTSGYQDTRGVVLRVGETPRNGELSPSDRKTPEPYNSPFRARNPERSSDSNSTQKMGC